MTLSLAKIKNGYQDKLILGNLEAKRDWGYAKDYVEAMWLMLQQDKPDDYVIATGQTHTIRELVEIAGEACGFNIEWKGSGLNEIGIDSISGNVIVETSEKYIRPSEVDYLCGDSKKALEILKWKPKTSFKELIQLMMISDLKNLTHID